MPGTARITISQSLHAVSQRELPNLYMQHTTSHNKAAISSKHVSLFGQVHHPAVTTPITRHTAINSSGHRKHVPTEFTEPVVAYKCS